MRRAELLAAALAEMLVSSEREFQQALVEVLDHRLLSERGEQLSINLAREALATVVGLLEAAGVS